MISDWEDKEEALEEEQPVMDAETEDTVDEDGVDRSEVEAEESSVALVLSETPIDRLSTKQVTAALRMIQFPGSSMQSIADSVGVSRQTIYNWKKDADFKAFLSDRQSTMVEKSISVRAKRNAEVYDKVHDELLSRMGAPETDDSELKRILGTNYTQAEYMAYRSKFITNASLKDVFGIWTALEEKTRKDGEQIGTGTDEMTILRKIQDKYEEYKSQRRVSEGFQKRSGFTYDVDFNEIPADQLYDAPDVQESENSSESVEDTEEDFLDMFDAEKT